MFLNSNNLRSLICSDVPHEYHSEDELIRHFSTFGEVEAVVTSSKRNRAKVVFVNSLDAQSAKEHGAVIDELHPPMKLYYADDNRVTRYKNKDNNQQSVDNAQDEQSNERETVVRRVISKLPPHQTHSEFKMPRNKSSQLHLNSPNSQGSGSYSGNKSNSLTSGTRSLTKDENYSNNEFTFSKPRAAKRSFQSPMATSPNGSSVFGRSRIGDVRTKVLQKAINRQKILRRSAFTSNSQSSSKSTPIVETDYDNPFDNDESFGRSVLDEVDSNGFELELKKKRNVDKERQRKLPIATSEFNEEAVCNSSDDNDNDSFNSLSLSEKIEILKRRDEKLRNQMMKTSKLSHVSCEEQTAFSNVVKGTCDEMCPELEKYVRHFTNRVDYYEMSNVNVGHGGSSEPDYNKFVKEYTRSSADKQIPLAHEVRSITGLKLSMDYLMHSVMNDLLLYGNINSAVFNTNDINDIVKNQFNRGIWFNFLWNRTRGIRNDITLQNLHTPEAVQVMEQITRFHMLCAYELCDSDYNDFDSKVNEEHYNKSMQTLKHMYYDLHGYKSSVDPEDRLNSNTEPRFFNNPCPNQLEFRCYDIINNLQSCGSSFLETIKSWSESSFSSDAIHSKNLNLALKLHNCFINGNYVRFLRLCKNEANYLMSCLLHPYINKARIEIITSLTNTCGATNSNVYSVDEMKHLLVMSTEEQTISYCRQQQQNGIQIDELQQLIKINKSGGLAINEENSVFTATPFNSGIKTIEKGDTDGSRKDFFLIGSKKKQFTIGQIVMGIETDSELQRSSNNSLMSTTFSMPRPLFGHSGNESSLLSSTTFLLDNNFSSGWTFANPIPTLDASFDDIQNIINKNAVAQGEKKRIHWASNVATECRESIPDDDDVDESENSVELDIVESIIEEELESQIKSAYSEMKYKSTALIQCINGICEELQNEVVSSLTESVICEIITEEQSLNNLVMTVYYSLIDDILGEDISQLVSTSPVSDINSLSAHVYESLLNEVMLEQVEAIFNRKGKLYFHEKKIRMKNKQSLLKKYFTLWKYRKHQIKMTQYYLFNFPTHVGENALDITRSSKSSGITDVGSMFNISSNFESFFEGVSCEKQLETSEDVETEEDESFSTNALVANCVNNLCTGLGSCSTKYIHAVILNIDPHSDFSMKVLNKLRGPIMCNKSHLSYHTQGTCNAVEKDELCDIIRFDSLQFLAINHVHLCISVVVTCQFESYVETYQPNCIIILDPESSLHPDWLQSLAEASVTNNFVQLYITAVNDDPVDNSTSPSNIDHEHFRVIEKDGVNHLNLPWYDHKNIRNERRCSRKFNLILLEHLQKLMSLSSASSRNLRTVSLPAFISKYFNEYFSPFYHNSWPWNRKACSNYYYSTNFFIRVMRVEWLFEIYNSFVIQLGQFSMSNLTKTSHHVPVIFKQDPSAVEQNSENELSDFFDALLLPSSFLANIVNCTEQKVCYDVMESIVDYFVYGQSRHNVETSSNSVLWNLLFVANENLDETKFTMMNKLKSIVDQFLLSVHNSPTFVHQSCNSDQEPRNVEKYDFPWVVIILELMLELFESCLNDRGDVSNLNFFFVSCDDNEFVFDRSKVECWKPFLNDLFSHSTNLSYVVDGTVVLLK